jgi:hypothetical protein
VYRVVHKYILPCRNLIINKDGCLGPINIFDPATFFTMFNDLGVRGDCFVDIREIVDHHCLINFLFIIIAY